MAVIIVTEGSAAAAVLVVAIKPSIIKVTAIKMLTESTDIDERIKLKIKLNLII